VVGLSLAKPKISAAGLLSVGHCAANIKL
jgi:hypothetical protein